MHRCSGWLDIRKWRPAMPQLSDDFAVELTPAEVSAACRRACAQLGWTIGLDRPSEIVISVAMLSTSWPSKIRVRLLPHDGGHTRVSVDGRIGGEGHIQIQHLAGQVNRLRAAIQGDDGAPATSDGDQQHFYGVIPDDSDYRFLARSVPLPRVFGASILVLAVIVAAIMMISVGEGASALPKIEPRLQRLQQVEQQIRQALDRATQTVPVVP